MSRFGKFFLSPALLALLACPAMAEQKTGGAGGSPTTQGNPAQPSGGTGQTGNPAQTGGTTQPGNTGQPPGGTGQPGNPAQPQGTTGQSTSPGQPQGNPASTPPQVNPGQPQGNPASTPPQVNPGQPKGNPIQLPGTGGTNNQNQGNANPAQLPGTGGTANQNQGNANTGMAGQTGTAPGFAGNSINQTPWFAQAGIQKGLNLTNEQMNQLNSAHNNAYNQYKSNYDKWNNMTPQQRAEQGINAPGTYNNQMNQAVQSSLNPQQYQRYQQLQLQYQGLHAFSDPSVQQKLNLTPAQIQKLQTYQNDQTQRWNEVYKFSGSDPQRAKAGYQSLMAQNDLLMRSVLNPQQLNSWNEMVGAPYNFEPHWSSNK